MPEYDVTVRRTEIFKGRVTAPDQAAAEENALADVAENDGSGDCLMRYSGTDEDDVTVDIVSI